MSKKVYKVAMFTDFQKEDIWNSFKNHGYNQQRLALLYSCSIDTIRRVIKEVEAAQQSSEVSEIVGVVEAGKMAEAAAITKPSVMAGVKPEDVVWAGSSKFLSITIGRNTYAADNSHKNFKEALQCAVDGEFERAVDLINIEVAITRYVDGNVRIENGQLFYQDIEIKSGLVTRIIDDMNNGKDFKFYLPFLENALENPSPKAVERLFDFLEANDIEITKTGKFLAWKVVTEDFKDCYTRTLDNSVGKTVSMPRARVNDNDEQTCSSGLHVCAKSYIRIFSSMTNKLVQVQVHPRDVVSIPVDYGNAKMRCCKYKVLREVSIDEFRS